MTVNSISDRCNMTYENYINQPMNIARNPYLLVSLDRNKNHPLIRKHSHIPFNN